MAEPTQQTSTQLPPQPTLDMDFPFGAQPDIIRANQKDVYYQMVLQEQMTRVAQQFLGARRQHQWQKEINTLSDLSYYGLTTLLGTQTLGEEYCDLVQINQYTQTYPGIIRRFVLVFTQAVLPYIYTRSVSKLKKRARNTNRNSDVSESKDQGSIRQSVIQFFKANLNGIQDFFVKHVRPVHLAVFYFFGAYYNFSKRFAGIRYIFSRQLGLSEQRAGYEVLGVLIVLQMMIQGGLSIRKKILASQQLAKQQQEDDAAAAADAEAAEDAQAVLEQKEKLTVEQDDFDFMDSVVLQEEEELDEEKEEELTYEQMQMLKCALCLEQRTVTTTTPCGHLFCWNCVVEWCQNKPECPLCRSNVNIAHLVPLNNF